MGLIGNYLEKTIFAIEDGVSFSGKREKQVHFLAFGYLADLSCEIDKSKPCRFVEYCGFFAPLHDVVAMDISNYEGEYGCDHKQYITDCTEEEMVGFYEHYDNGKMPVSIEKKDLNENTPCGVYVLA